MDINFKNKAAKELDRITLKAEKVELGSLDMLKKLTQINYDTYLEVKNIQKEFIEAIDKLDKLAKEVRRINNDAEKMADKAFFALEDFEKNAKDLGINFKIKEYNDLEQSASSVIAAVEQNYKILKGRK